MKKLNFPKLFEYKKFLNNKRQFYILGVKFTIRLHKFSTKEIFELNHSYEINDTQKKYPQIHNQKKTLESLINTECSIARFGDGEFNIMLSSDIPFQRYSNKLAQRLKQIIVSDNSNMLIAIPNTFSSLSEYTQSAASFWRTYMVYNRKIIYSLLNLDKQYFDSLVSRPYMDALDKSNCEKYFETFKKVWDKKDIIFVEGSSTHLGVGNSLFDNANSIKRIICPQKNAFDKYDEILEYCKKQPKDILFILALGPTATVLAYDLAQAGFRALDLGHIDIEYEWFLHKASTKIAIKNKYVNEAANGRITTNSSDEKYNNEIIINFAKLKH